jgi:hypothetical protein
MVYLSSESAWCLLQSTLAVHLVVSLSFWRCRDLETQLISTSFFAIQAAKFCIISLVGGSPLFVNPSMYHTRSSSCCWLSNCCCADLTAFDCVRPWCLQDNVDRLQYYLAATFWYKQGAPSSPLLIDAIALSIADILVDLSRVQGWCQSGVLMLGTVSEGITLGRMRLALQHESQEAQAAAFTTSDSTCTRSFDRF